MYDTDFGDIKNTFYCTEIDALVLTFDTVIMVASFKDDSILRHYKIEQEENVEQVSIDSWYPTICLPGSKYTNLHIFF